MFEESAIRSVFKAISWRILATVTTVLVVYALTGRADILVKVALLETVAKMALYYGHERFWNRLNVGRWHIVHPAGGTTEPALAAPNRERE